MGEVVKARLAILIGTHGRGSNMAAIADACVEGRTPAEVAVVISANETADAVTIAREKGLTVVPIPYKSEDYAESLMRTLRENRVDWMCLAGYMRLLPPEVLDAYPNRVLNIHPALLPKFGGKGMYGMHVHEAVLAAGEKESGCSVHYVNERYDEGAVIFQLRCPVEPGDTPETLAARVLKLEHKAYALALNQVIAEDGR